MEVQERQPGVGVGEGDAGRAPGQFGGGRGGGCRHGLLGVVICLRNLWVQTWLWEQPVYLKKKRRICKTDICDPTLQNESY